MGQARVPMQVYLKVDQGLTGEKTTKSFYSYKEEIVVSVAGRSDRL